MAGPDSNRGLVLDARPGVSCAWRVLSTAVAISNYFQRLHRPDLWVFIDAEDRSGDYLCVDCDIRHILYALLGIIMSGSREYSSNGLLTVKMPSLNLSFPTDSSSARRG